MSQMPLKAEDNPFNLPEIVTSFYFIRHGQTDWNKEGRMQGSTDVPLNDTGREQAKACIPVIEKLAISQVIASPLKRAYETAEILVKPLGYEITAEPALQERSFGSNERKFKHELPPRLEAARHTPEDIKHFGPSDFPHSQDTERFDAFSQRVFNALSRFKENKNQTYPLIVAHGGLFACLAYHLTGNYDHSDNSVPYFFEKKDSQWTIIKLG